MQYSSDLHVIMLTSIVESNCLVKLRPNLGNKQTLTLTAGPEGFGEFVVGVVVVGVVVFKLLVWANMCGSFLSKRARIFISKMFMQVCA